MTLAQILNTIKQMIQYFHPGRAGTPGFIIGFSNFIVNHPLILFFVLLSLLSIGITLIRRMIRS